ncbi:MAG: bacillithiol biosynthesis BshC [Gemmatimonadales bacterium]
MHRAWPFTLVLLAACFGGDEEQPGESFGVFEASGLMVEQSCGAAIPAADPIDLAFDLRREDGGRAYWHRIGGPSFAGLYQGDEYTFTVTQSWMVIEPKVARVLEALDLNPHDLSDGGAEIVERSVRGGRPEAVARALQEADAAREAAFDLILEAVSAEIPGIRATAEKARAGARKAARQLEKAVDASVLERQSVLRRQIEKTARHLFPGGIPQERVLNPLYYLARFGPEVLESLDREVEMAVEEYVARLDGTL